MFSFSRKWQPWAVLSVIALSACQTVTVTPSPVTDEVKPVVYTIRKGEHSSEAPFQVRKVSALTFEATFNASAMYETANKENQADINKLYGVADCHTDHHSNSARFGWRWFNNQLEIHAYTYLNKVRQSKLVDIVELNKAYTYEIILTDNKYTFKLNGKTVELPRHCNGQGEGYQLYPYFGGDETAPHDIIIAIRELGS
jgi:hypothetical protein